MPFEANFNNFIFSQKHISFSRLEQVEFGAGKRMSVDKVAYRVGFRGCYKASLFLIF